MASQITQVLAATQTDYAVFQTDQVLTPDQLNSVSRYFDGQTRRSRIGLTGVGIISGLQVSLQSNLVTLAAGVGVTTDGDLLMVSPATVYDRYKIYDDSNPAYVPLSPGGKQVNLYELVPQGATDARATPLGQFQSVPPATTALGGMVAFLLVQSYNQNTAQCTGSDCDNLGAEFQNRQRLLLLDPASVGLLTANAVAALPGVVTAGEVISRRVVIPVPASISTPAILAGLYRSAGNAMQADLQPALTSLAASRPDLLPPMTVADWITQLNALQTAYGTNDTGIQYYYGFLKDLVETYNALRRLLAAAGSGAVVCPNLNAFPKHLLLGLVTPGADPSLYRTGFYPSPASLVAVDDLNHALLLVRRLGAMVQSFAAPAAGTGPADIRITPSRFEDRPLEERAIPYYYQNLAANPLYLSWSYPLHRAGLDHYNYSYRATEYGALGAAANPLAASLGAYPFFRIEGHLGQPVDAVVSALEAQIAANNLDFVVRTVSAGTDLGLIWKRPGLRYGPLNSLHYLLRQHLVTQIAEVQKFNTSFPAQIAAATTEASTTAKQAAATASQTLADSLTTLQGKLNVSFAAYQPAVWKPTMTTAISAAATFKNNIGDVVQQDFASPFDPLIGAIHWDWLDWLDQIIALINQQADTGLLLNNFLADNPSLAHFAGVPRGGTFVLAYDSATKRVVADFMLAYRLPDPIQPFVRIPLEPPLLNPGLRPPSLASLNIIQPLHSFVTNQVTTAFNSQFKPAIDLQTSSLSMMKDSFTLLAATHPAATGTGVSPAKTSIADPYLNGQSQKIGALQSQIDYLTTQAAQPGVTPAAKTFYTAQISANQTALAGEIQNTSNYVSTTGAAVTPGSDGFQTLMQANTAISKISDTTIAANLKTGLTTTATSTTNPGLKTFINTGLLPHM